MRRVLALAALVVVPRLLVLPLNENLYGDAVARTWLAERWAEAPHVIGSFEQGARQFGPLHLYLIALAEWLWPSPMHAGRLVSFVAGVLTAWPLHVLTRRLFGQKAADWAVIAFAAWGMHIQCSTTAAGEALNLALVLATVALLQVFFDSGVRAWALAAALVMNLACATRYDSWLMVPLLVALIWWRGRSAGAATVFGLASSAFAAAWMFGNWVDLGQPLYPFSFIDDFHRRWFPAEQAGWGATTYRWMTLLFWPGTAVATLTPIVALSGMAGAARSWKARPDLRWLVLIVVVPATLYTVRSTLLSSFVPLARFAVKEVALLLPFAWFGAQPLLDRLSPRLGRALVSLSLAMAVAWPVWLGWFTFRREGTWENTLRPVSPTSTNPPALMETARVLETRGAGLGGVLIVDADPRGYDDLQVGFFSGFPFSRLARIRSPLFEGRLQRGRWIWVLRFEGGPLEQVARISGTSLEFRGALFEEVLGAAPPMHLYRRID